MNLRRLGTSACLRGAASLLFAFVAVGCRDQDPEAELAAAIQSIEAGNYDEATLQLNYVVQLLPDSVEARRVRGELGLLVGDYVAAAAELDRARELGAPIDSLAVGLAEAWTAVGQPDRALAVLDAAAETLAFDATYWTARAAALLAAGRLAEAQDALVQGDRIGDGGARAEIIRARVAYAREALSEAQEILDRALEGAPDDPEVLIARSGLRQTRCRCRRKWIL